MIVQSARDGAPHFVIPMAEHTAFAGALARAFGNEAFEPVSPREEMLHVIDNHDAGWADYDARAPRSPKTGLPYNLVETPFADIVKTSAGSPSFNSKRHAYCGLISSMHSWGLYNGRYGMSDLVLLDTLATENRTAADRMLDGELERQAALKAELAADPATAPWIEEAHLFQNYKQLQFFDTLALYFNRVHEGARTEQVFTHVPRSTAEDVDVRIRPLGAAVYALDPFPFNKTELEVGFRGRYLAPVQNGAAETLGEVLAMLPQERQTVVLVPG
jgi:hypothetical protein